MALSTFSCTADDTRLIKHGGTVYKLKVMLAGGTPPRTQLEKEAQASSFHGQMEEVVCAVIFMVENDKRLVKIQTQDFFVVPSLKAWKAGEVLGFRQNGKELNVFPKVITLTVTPSSCQGGRRQPESASTVPAAVPSQQGTGEKERPAAGLVRSEGGGGDVQREERRVQQNSRRNTADAETRGSVAEKTVRRSGGESGAQQLPSRGRVISPPARSVVLPVLPEPTAHSSVAPATIHSMSEHTSVKRSSASTKAPSPRARVPRKPSPPHAGKDSLQASSTDGVVDAAGAGKAPRGQGPADASDQASSNRTRSQTAAQTGQQKKAVQIVSAESSSTLSYNLRQAVRNLSQSPKSSSPARVQVRNSSNASSLVENRRAGDVRSGRGNQSGKSEPSEPPPGKKMTGSAERDGLKSDSNRKDNSQNTSARSLSPRRTRPPLRSVETSEVSSRHKTREDASSKPRQQNPPGVSFAPLQSVPRNAARRPEAGRPLRQHHRAPARGLLPNPRRYDLRQTVHRGTVAEEQRLKGMSSDPTGAAHVERRPLPPRPVVRTFEQKDRHVVETGDMQEELKLQAMANAHNQDREDNSSPPKGTKRRSGLLLSLAEGIVAPLKRALRAYTETV